jgi:hypothetical protein
MTSFMRDRKRRDRRHDSRPRRLRSPQTSARSESEICGDFGIREVESPSGYLNMYPRLRFLANRISSANPAVSLLSKNSRRCRPVEPIRPQRRTNVFLAKRVASTDKT